MNPDYLGLTGALQLLTLFVVGPLLDKVIAYSAGRGKLQNFKPEWYGKVCTASGVIAVLPLVFAKWLNADVRSGLYFLQLACILLSGPWFGVCMGCFFPVVLRAWRWHKTTRLTNDARRER